MKAWGNRQNLGSKFGLNMHDLSLAVSKSADARDAPDCVFPRDYVSVGSLPSSTA